MVNDRYRTLMADLIVRAWRYTKRAHRILHNASQRKDVGSLQRAAQFLDMARCYRNLYKEHRYSETSGLLFSFEWDDMADAMRLERY